MLTRQPGDSRPVADAIRCCRWSKLSRPSTQATNSPSKTTPPASDPAPRPQGRERRSTGSSRFATSSVIRPSGVTCSTALKPSHLGSSTVPPARAVAVGIVSWALQSITSTGPA